jgi:threonine dehydratase
MRLDGHARRTPLLNFAVSRRDRRPAGLGQARMPAAHRQFQVPRRLVGDLGHGSPEDRARGVIAFSSGNHAQGVALAAARHGAPAVIIMPSDAPKMKIDNTRALGAEVVLYDRATEDRDEIGARLSASAD